MTIPTRSKGVTSGRKVGLRGGASNKFALPPAPSTHRMGTRKSRPFPNPSTECPICLEEIRPLDDYLKCVAQCRKFHRDCFVQAHGQPCLCQGLLCKEHPLPNQGRFPNYIRACSNCQQPAWPNTRDAIDQKWRLIFASHKFKTYIRRQYPGLWAGDGWKMFHPDHLVMTNNDEWGRNPMIMYNVLRANGDSAAEAWQFIYEMYRISRTTFPTIPGPPFLVRHVLLPSHYKFLFRGSMRIFIGPDPPFARRYRWDRVLYYHLDPISDGRDAQPLLTGDVQRICRTTNLNGLMHYHYLRGGGVWDDFRLMFERPRADWGLWN